MTQPKFTPGPWINTGMFIEDDRGNVIAAGVDNRNAPVIAAAPTAHDLIVRAVTGIDIEWIVEAHAYLGKVAGGAQ